MAKQIVPSDFKTHLIDQLIESVDEPSNTVYYAFVGNHANTGIQADDVVAPTQKLQDLNVDTYRNMIFGKRLTSGDFSVMIPRYDWTSGTVYSAYDDEDATLFDKKFYVAVDETSYIHVYKCLSNANGAASNAQPTFGDVTTNAALFANNDEYYETSDGYQWKYMYSVDSTTFDKFATQSFMPVVANTQVENNAKNGAIDVIKVDTHGRFYNNTLASDFSESSIIGGTTVKLPAGSKQIVNFYANTIMHLVAGEGVGQYRRVTASTANGSGQYVTLESAFITTPNSNTQYQISPEVRITSDGTQTVNAVARAIVNANASNSIHRIEVLEAGLNYNYANAVILTATPDETELGVEIPVVAATVRAIIPPPGGHGANSAVELGGRILGIHAKFSNTESNTVIADNVFTQFGIIRDPLFANVQVTTIKQSDGSAGVDGDFVEGENIKQITRKKLCGTYTVESGNTIIVANSDQNLDEELNAGEYLFVTDGSVATENHLAFIESVINSTSIQLNTAPSWDSSSANLYFATITANAVVKEVVSSTTILLEQCDNKFVGDKLIVGMTSQAVANVSAINVNGRLASNAVYDFAAFNQMIRLSGTVTGTILENDTLSQTSTGASALVHSVSGSNVFVTRVTGTFSNSAAIVSANNGGTIGIGFTRHDGELDPTSGSIIYLQNDIAVSRANNSSEEIRIILEF